jgi:hypothetical protein
MDGLQEVLKQYFATPIIYAAAIYGIFAWLDSNASDEAKAALAATMKLKEFDNKRIAFALVEVFDRIYTHPLFSFRAFARSLLFSVVVSAAYAFAFFDLKFMYRALFAILGGQPVTFWEPYFIYGTLAMVFFNAMTDYAALFIIRVTLVRLGGWPLIALISSMVAAISLVTIAQELRTFVVVRLLVEHPRPPIAIAKAALEWLLLSPSDPLTGIAAIAVFAWIPLFAVGIAVARALTPLSWLTGKTQWFLREGHEHPLKAVGCVASATTFAIGVLLQKIVG